MSATRTTFIKPVFVKLKDQDAHHRKRWRSRYKGSSLYSTSSKGGKVGKGCYFDDMKYSSNEYLDPYKVDLYYRRKRRKEMKKILDITIPFRYSSPTCASKSYFEMLKLKRLSPVVRGKKKIKKYRKSVPRNFVTNPSKRGSYGVFGTTIDKNPWKSEGKIPPDTYGMSREMKRRERKKHEEIMRRRRLEKDFLPSGRCRQLFDGHQRFDDSLRLLEIPEEFLRPPSPREKTKALEPFIAGQPPKERIGKFPEFIPENSYPSSSSFKKQPPEESPSKIRIRKEKYRKVTFPRLGDASSNLSFGYRKLCNQKSVNLEDEIEVKERRGKYFFS